MNPERLEHVMLVSRIVFIQGGTPAIDGRDDIRRVAPTQFNFRPFADLVLGFFEQVEQRRNGRARDLGWLHEGAPFAGDAINAPMLVITAWIPQVMLHMADDG